MFFDDDEGIFNQEFFHVVRREFCTLGSNLDVTPYGIRSVPTHTEDGIPIRKLYVSNLPPKTTRTELFGVFAQYGFIKSCWLRMGEKGPNRTPTPTYAFVTYSSPGDAHKALQAPDHEKLLRGRHLRISPADSWHQPAVDADGRVRWKPRGQRRDTGSPTSVCEHDTSTPESSENGEAKNSEQTSEQGQEESTGEPTYSILDILNRDCLAHILTYVPISDLIRSERVSKGWQNMIHEYFESIRTFKTSWWEHSGTTLTTAVLRRVLRRLVGLARLHIDHHWSALNDRTAHTVGKFCPHLEELKVVGMNTKNWNPLMYGCKQLKTLSFVSCNKLTDTSLVHIVKSDCHIESLTVANNTHVTGFFLTGNSPSSLSHLTSLAFYNCYNLQGTVLNSAIEFLPNLTTLKLDVCPEYIWKMVPTILKKLPRLEVLSLSEYSSVELFPTATSYQELCEALATLTELRSLDVSRNIYMTNMVMKQVAQSCPKLHYLNISCCNSRKNFPYPGISDEGVAAICSGCPLLECLDISYLGGVGDTGASSAAQLQRLRRLLTRGNPALTDSSLSTVITSCPQLEEVDACGCDSVGAGVVSAAMSAMSTMTAMSSMSAMSARFPDLVLTLRLAATAAATHEHEFPPHKLVLVDTNEDLSNPQLRPDFVDDIFDDSSDNTFDDVFVDADDFDDFFQDDDDLYLVEQFDDEYDDMIYGDILLL